MLDVHEVRGSTPLSPTYRFSYLRGTKEKPYKDDWVINLIVQFKERAKKLVRASRRVGKVRGSLIDPWETPPSFTNDDYQVYICLQ